MFGHRFDGVRNDAEPSALLPRMDQADRVANGIGKINGAAIGDVNAEANAPLVCDQAITTVETLVPCGRLIDNTNTLSMHLLRGNERCAAESVCASDFPMNAVQPRERLHFIMRHFDAGNTQGETMHQIGQRAERLELFSRELTCAHLLEVVVRVRVLVWTGCLSPA